MRVRLRSVVIGIRLQQCKSALEVTESIFRHTGEHNMRCKALRLYVHADIPVHAWDGIHNAVP